MRGEAEAFNNCLAPTQLCMVTDLPEKKESCGCGGHGGAPDMGGMM